MSAPTPMPVVSDAETYELERQLIGKLLAVPENCSSFVLPLEAITLSAHRVLYKAILDLRYNGHEESDMPTAICKLLGNSLGEVGGVQYLHRLVTEACDTIAPSYEAERLNCLHEKRKADEAITAMVKARDAGGDVVEILAGTTAKLKELQAFPPGCRVRAADRDNYGIVISDDGDECAIEFTSAEGQTAIVNLPKSKLTLLTGGADPKAPVEPESIGNLMVTHPDLEPERIYGLLRRGEVGSIIAAPKVGKTFLTHDFALSAAYGFPWLDFPVERGRVALFDFELHKKTICFRLRKLAERRELDLSAAAIDVFSLRGKGLDLLTLDPTMQAIVGKYAYIVIDAWYRAIPPGMDENSNSDMTTLFNRLDAYAGQTGATIIVVHHASKGNQGGKSVTDVGAGAGSQARAVDCHLVIREHEQEGGFVVEAACRSFAPIKPFCIRKDFPIWQRADDLDPSQVKQERRGRGDRQKKEEEAQPIQPWSVERFVREFITDQPRKQKLIENYAHDAGLSVRQVWMYLEQVRDEKLCFYQPNRGKQPAMYSLKPFEQKEFAA